MASATATFNELRQRNSEDDDGVRKGLGQEADVPGWLQYHRPRYPHHYCMPRHPVLNDVRPIKLDRD